MINNPELRIYINESFEVSDFDFTVYLKTETLKKFAIVKKHLIDFLINQLEKINI